MFDINRVVLFRLKMSGQNVAIRNSFKKDWLKEKISEKLKVKEHAELSEKEKKYIESNPRILTHENIET